MNNEKFIKARSCVVYATDTVGSREGRADLNSAGAANNIHTLV